MRIDERCVRSKGFTLIELLVVVIIIGILAAAVIANYRDYTLRASLATLRSDLAAMRSSLVLYKMEHRLPPGVWRDSSDPANPVERFVASDGADSGLPFQRNAFGLGVDVSFGPIVFAGPGTAGDAPAANLFDQLLSVTNQEGRRDGSAGTLRFGPYLRDLPVNLAGLNLQNRASLAMRHPLDPPAAEADTNAGFHYDPYTLQIMPTGAVRTMPDEEVELGNETLQDL